MKKGLFNKKSGKNDTFARMYWILYNLRIKDSHRFIDKETDNFPFRVFGVFFLGFALVCVGEWLEFNELCCINDKKKKKPVLYIYFFLPSSNQQPNSYRTKFKLKKPRISIRYKERLLLLFGLSILFTLVSHKTIAFHILLAITLLSRFLFCFLATISIMLS